MGTIKCDLLIVEAELSVNRNKYIEKKEKFAIDNIKLNPKYFYKYARSKSKNSQCIGLLSVSDRL